MTKPYEPMPADWERALCVVAHPDDLEYGPACAVARWTTQGKFVAYAVASRGEAGIATMAPDATGAMRAGEQLRAAAVVGVRDVDFLGHPDGIIEYGLPLRRDLARSIRKYRPDALVTINFCERWRSGDWNTPDHRNVGVALLDAAADAGNPWVFPELVDEGFPPWDGVRFVAVGGSRSPGTPSMSPTAWTPVSRRWPRTPAIWRRCRRTTRWPTSPATSPPSTRASASALATCRPCRSRSSVSEPDQQPAAENSRQWSPVRLSDGVLHSK